MIVRPARPDEAGLLTALCKRSKAHWGYDADFMAKSETSLTITPELIAGGNILVAEDRGHVVGVASLAAIDENTFDLLHMFTEPNAIGTGVGRLLFRNVAALAKGQGAKLLSILADPNAEAFYTRMGARKVSMAPSDPSKAACCHCWNSISEFTASRAPAPEGWQA